MYYSNRHDSEECDSIFVRCISQYAPDYHYFCFTKELPEKCYSHEAMYKMFDFW